MTSTSPSNTQSIFTALSMLILGITITLIWTDISQNATTGQTNVLDNEETEPSIVNVTEDNDAAMGANDAPITMIEFSDYQCPFCRAFYNDTLTQIKENYIDQGLVRLVFRDLPLVSLGHTDATPAANAAECARAQKGDEIYFAFHDLIFEGENKLGSGTVKIPEESLYAYAEKLGLNMEEFGTCQENQEFYEEIEKDSEEARVAGINGTPTFVINGEMVVGAQPYAVFEGIFNEILNSK